MKGEAHVYSLFVSDAASLDFSSPFTLSEDISNPYVFFYETPRRCGQLSEYICIKDDEQQFSSGD